MTYGSVLMQYEIVFSLNSPQSKHNLLPTNELKSSLSPIKHDYRGKYPHF